MMNNTDNNGSDGRSAGGLFAKGNKLARGNAVNRRMGELRRAALEAETPERVAAVIGKLRELATEGDVPAARVYLETVIGRAPQAVEVSGPDGESLGLGLVQVEAAILDALAPFGQRARFAVALALRGLVNAGGAEAPGD